MTTQGFNWRLAVWIDAIIAVVRGYAKAHLRETPDFVDASARLLRKYEKANIDKKELKNDEIFYQKPKRRQLYIFS
ncbi:hypothetical protein [Rickettsia conorii]|uniref:Proline/betaine transporter-like protein n=1 Tax=Rickettsia conorii (strain ATCC VR-613 / Malish 7) TaxID=272944 RepID=Q92GM1_RICCN|nr:hypothetical protein [Rickettsia conorii]AAL03640.1 proline/betaine transporter-like protein [Rickettsia conorii str. Malish 7]